MYTFSNDSIGSYFLCTFRQRVKVSVVIPVCLADVAVVVPGVGEVVVDISYGGAFYAFVPASRLGLDLATSPASKIADVAYAVSGLYPSQISGSDWYSQYEKTHNYDRLNFYQACCSGEKSSLLKLDNNTCSVFLFL